MVLCAYNRFIGLRNSPPGTSRNQGLEIGMASIIKEAKVGSTTLITIEGVSADELDKIHHSVRAKQNEDGTVRTSAQNKLIAQQIRSLVESANLKPVGSVRNNRASRYTELLAVAERDGLNHGQPWAASELDIDKHHLPPHAGGQYVCYVYPEADVSKWERIASESHKYAKSPGRPETVKGKACNVYLDADSLETASRLGDGNVSAGIRKALEIAGKDSRKI